jgi:hypothetical protein
VVMIRAKVGEVSANRKSAKFGDLFFLDFRISAKVAICGFSICGPYIFFNLRICALRTIYFLIFADLRFEGPIIFCELKTSANP